MMKNIPAMSAPGWKAAKSQGGLHPGLTFYRFLEEEGGNFQAGLKLMTTKVSLPFADTLVRRVEDQCRFLEDNGWVTCCFRARLVSRLAVGLGLPNPTENGLWLDQTHGLPLIPGSVLKGVSQDYAQLERGEWPGLELMRNDPEFIALFGAQTPSPPDRHFQARQGQVIFFDAFPILKGSNPFDLDIINPHYQPYYAQPATNQPADYYSPVPIVFLAVREDIAFQFALAAREADFTWKNSQGIESHYQISALDLLIGAASYLKGAITELGVGAKTSVGFGRFELLPEKK